MRAKFWLPIFSTVALIFGYGLTSGLFTKSAYEFSGQYEELGSEKVNLRFTNGRVKMQYIAYGIDGEIVQSKQMFGVFLRWGNHYYLYQLEQNGAQNKQSFNIKNLFIQELNDKRSIFISDQRGTYITKHGKSLDLKGILYGKSLR